MGIGALPRRYAAGTCNQLCCVLGSVLVAVAPCTSMAEHDSRDSRGMHVQLRRTICFTDSQCVLLALTVGEAVCLPELHMVPGLLLSSPQPC